MGTWKKQHKQVLLLPNPNRSQIPTGPKSQQVPNPILTQEALEAHIDHVQFLSVLQVRIIVDIECTA